MYTFLTWALVPPPPPPGLLHPGDIIHEINGKNILGFTVDAVADLMAGLRGTVVFKITPAISDQRPRRRSQVHVTCTYEVLGCMLFVCWPLHTTCTCIYWQLYISPPLTHILILTGTKIHASTLLLWSTTGQACTMSWSWPEIWTGWHSAGGQWRWPKLVAGSSLWWKEPAGWDHPQQDPPGEVSTCTCMYMCMFLHVHACACRLYIWCEYGDCETNLKNTCFLFQGSSVLNSSPHSSLLRREGRPRKPFTHPLRVKVCLYICEVEDKRETKGCEREYKVCETDETS